MHSILSQSRCKMSSVKWNGRARNFHIRTVQAPEECSKIKGVCCIYTCALLISSKHRPEERNKCGKNSGVIDSAALVTALLDERERCTSNCAGCPVAWLYNCSHIVGAPPERIHLRSSLVQTLESWMRNYPGWNVSRTLWFPWCLLPSHCAAITIREIESKLWHFYMGAPLILCECVDCFSYILSSSITSA